MTNKQLRAEAKTARYVLEPLDAARIERTLSRLPKRRQRNIWDKFAVAVPVAAAIMAFIIFAMPPIVEAVGSLIERIFAERVDQIEQYQAFPDDERLAQLAEDYDASGLYHELEGAEVDFEGVKVKVVHIDARPEDYYDESRKDGRIYLSLEYSEVPPFDPNWMEFTLHYAGASYSFKDESVDRYREKGTRATTKEDWIFEDDWELEGKTRLSGDVLTTSLYFDVDQWKPAEKADMVLEGTIDGKRFEIEFTFDPEKAHEENAKRAADDLDSHDRYAEESLSKLVEYADAAVPVGAKGELSGMEFSVAEIALVGSDFHIAASLSDVPEKNPTMASHKYSIDCIYLDGRMWGSNSWDNDEIEDGIFTFVANFNFKELLPTLGEESLICVQIMYYHPRENNNWDDTGSTDYGYAVFRYNWTTKVVTLPKDDAERDEWIKASDVKE